MIKSGKTLNAAIQDLLPKLIKESKKVIFNGDNYAEEWHQEAEKRGLPNVRTTPLALDAQVSDKAKNLFESNNVLTHVELEARHEIMLEAYIKPPLK
jgi:glutamine synthetase